MPPEAPMHKNCKIFVWGMVAATFALVALWGVPTSCVRLPNGMNIGKQALIDLGSPYFKPDIVPKFENGASLLPGDAWPFYATETTVYGLAMGASHHSDFWFAWRKDYGLVLKDENIERYEEIVSEAGDLLDYTKYGGFDSHIVMIDLQKRHIVNRPARIQVQISTSSLD